MCCQFCFVGSGTVRIHRLCVAWFFFHHVPIKQQFTIRINKVSVCEHNFTSVSAILHISFVFTSSFFVVSAGDFVPVKYFAALPCGIRSNFYSKSFPLRNFADWRKLSVFRRIAKSTCRADLNTKTMADSHRSIVEFGPIDPVGDGWTMKTDTHKFSNYTFNYFITIVP